MNAGANINKASAASASSIGKLSSGSRIVRPADDAASLAISNKLKSNIATLSQAKTNASQTSSLLQIAAGGVSRVSDILTRMKTLATQAVNGTVSDAERLVAQEEFSQMVKEVDNTVEQTQLNGIKLLAGKANAEVTSTAYNKGGASNLDSANLLSPSADFFSSAKISYRGNLNGTATGFATAATDLDTADASATAAAIAATNHGIVINGVTVGDSSGGTTASFAKTNTLQDVIDGINASSGLKAQGISARAYTTSSGKVNLEVLSKNDSPLTISFVGTQATTFEEVIGISTASTNKTVTQDYGVSNIRGNVQGVADAVRVSQDGTSSAYKIEIDIRNDKGVETFKGTVAAGAAQDNLIEFKSTVNDNNSFTIRAYKQLSSTFTQASFDAIKQDAQNLLGVGSGSAAVFAAKTSSAALDIFRSDIKSTAQLAGTTDFAGTTTATASTAGDTFTIGDGTNTTTITIKEKDGTSGISVQEFLDSVNSQAATTGVSATLRDNDVSGDKEIVFNSTEAGSTKTFTLTDTGGTPLADIGITSGATLVKPSAVNASSVTDPVASIISGTSSTEAGSYNLTSSYDSNTKATTFRIQDQKGNVYSANVADVDQLSTTDATTVKSVVFSNGVKLNFTVDRLAATKDNAVQFGAGDNQLSFNIGKFGNVSVTTQIGLDAYKDLVTVALDSVSTESLGITDANGASKISIGTVSDAQAAQGVIDNALNTVNKNTAKIGALQSRFSQIDSNLNTVIENSNAANGQFVDVDFSAESTTFYKNQALVQAAVGMAAQANQMPQQLLRLIG